MCCGIYCSLLPAPYNDICICRKNNRHTSNTNHCWNPFRVYDYLSTYSNLLLWERHWKRRYLRRGQQSLLSRDFFITALTHPPHFYIINREKSEVIRLDLINKMMLSKKRLKAGAKNSRSKRIASKRATLAQEEVLCRILILPSKKVILISKNPQSCASARV